MDLLSFLYWSTGIILIFYVVKSILLHKIKTLYIVDLFYILVYYFVPASICSFIALGNNPTEDLAMIDFSRLGIEQIGIMYLFVTTGFILVNIGYNIKIIKKRNKNVILNQNKILTIFAENPNKIRYSSILLMLFGWISLILWTSAYGGPIGILPYANLLRSGYDIGIYNKFSFFMRLCPFVQFSMYLFFSLFLSKKRVFDLVCFIISSIGTLLYILANSSRMHAILVFVVLFFIYRSYKDIKKKDYLIMAIICLLSLIFMHSAEVIMSKFQIASKEKIELSFDIFSILRAEFGYVILSFQTAFSKVYLYGEVKPAFFMDIVSGIFAWLPARFKPNGIMSIEVLNTNLIYGSMIYGGVPADFVSKCIYDFNIFGIIILPVVYGMFIKAFDTAVRPLISCYYYKVIYILGSFYFMKAVAYGDFSNIMSNIVTLVLSHLFITKICLRIKS
ncbi:O-antigen polymerase [Peptostreptococcus equinus]|uniref:O-antigen ligase n=1 Tax=Peptostreptococcus equinus TaxID=3003601 RepID=A0ABY7JR48_9FIRM|nr:O-antigen polymerase [Peptostreptococcus sp. CBA3647]WAW14152.1 O-antigen ligase [Peptostreptococcus sp. CBA3647]